MLGYGAGSVVQGEVSDEDYDPNKGRPDLGRWALQDVLAEARGDGKEDVLTEPEANLPREAEVLA